MLNRIQLEDCKECEEIQQKGQDKDCFGCSCGVCIAQVPNYYKKGLEKAIEIIEKEMEFARTVNPQMTAGMIQIKNLIKEEIEK